MTSVATTTPVPTANNNAPRLPAKGTARVKMVTSGDTVILLGKPVAAGGKTPEVLFTLEGISAPRLASKANSMIDEPGAFASREWLRKLVVGKAVQFETKRQGGASDRVYGWLYVVPDEANGVPIHVALESVRNGHATPKDNKQRAAAAAAANGDSQQPSETKDEAASEEEAPFAAAYLEAQNAKVGIHGVLPVTRTLKAAGDGFEMLALVQQAQKFGTQGRISCVLEHVFDGSRFRCQVTDPNLGPEWLYASFTLLLAGISCPRIGKDAATPSEEFAEDAKAFSEVRLLQRELPITLHGTDKSGICAVGTIHHPKGNIAVELLKSGLAKMIDWSVRLMNPLDVPALRIAEHTAKRTNLGVWHSYAPPQLSGASEVTGTVIEVLTGDTLAILPNGELYDSDSKVKKLSLASIRAPRAGNEKVGRADEPFCYECKERLRVLTIGKAVKVDIHYERDIPVGETTERRQFGTVSVGKRADVAEVLLAEGLALTQRHRDDDEKSPRYDELRAAEEQAKAAKKGVHSDSEYKRRPINDLTDPRKAKAYSGSLMRAGTVKAVVDFVLNGGLFKLYIPSENCHIIFAPNSVRCPQPTPPAGKQGAKAAEPFGDACKRHARFLLLQRNAEILCSGVTMGGVITGQLFFGQGTERRDYSIELVGAGLATVDPRKIEYGEAPKQLVDAQAAAQANKVGIWSLEQVSKEEKKPRSLEKSKDELKSVRISEIRAGNHFFFHLAGDDAVRVMDESMKLFTKTNGTSGAPCDVKVGKVVAVLFDDGTGKSWYRAKVVERKLGNKASVLFVDHGNMSTVSVATHLRPLDVTLGTDRIPPAAREAVLALTLTPPVDDDEGVEAATMLQDLGWGKDLAARIHATDDSGKLVVTLLTANGSSINEELVSAGLARVAKPSAVDALVSRMVDGSSVIKLAAEMNVAQESARKTRVGMWRYGDVGDDDDE